MNIKKFFTFLGWPLLLIPTLVLLLGAAMNETVIWANGSQMPVSMYSCVERINPPADPSDALLRFLGMPKTQAHKDYIHKCADKNTRLRLLDDWILADDGISSPGDILQEIATELNYVCFPLWIAGGIYFLFVRRKHYIS